MRVNRSSILFMFTIILFFSFGFSQTYSSPESAAYDAANDRYLISNLDGNIISVPRTNPGNLSFFSTGDCSSVRGLVLVDDILYSACTANDGATQVLLAFDMATGNVTKTIPIIEGSFINDVTYDTATGLLYLSDNNNIYRINPGTSTYGVYLQNAGANGLLYDGANNRLLYTDDTPQIGSNISAINLDNGVVSNLIFNTNFQSLDGLTVDHIGNYYVSCWSAPNAVYRYDPNFTSSVIASTGHNGINHVGAADVFYDQVNYILVVPNMGMNTVDLIPFSQLSSEEEDSIPSKITLHQNFPNPFNPNTSITYEVTNESLVNITIYDLLGAEVVIIVNQIEQPGVKTINWDGKDAKGNSVNGGVYVYRLTAGNYTETKKMVLLK